MKAFFLTFLLALSCTKYAELSSEGVSSSIKRIQMPISNLDEIPWSIGKWKDSKVSQSFSFLVSLPKITEKDFEKIHESKGMNAWILRVIFVQNNKSQDLGSLYVPIGSKKVLRSQAHSFPTSVAIKIYYSAAYPSERFRFSNCPAFNHRKRIKNLKINGEDDAFEISIDQTLSYPEKSQMVEFAPSAFNGGESLKGEFFIEIAPYEVEKKIILAAFKRIPQSIEVLDEDYINVPSCDGIHPENQ